MKEEQEFIDYFVVKDKIIEQRARYLTIVPEYEKTFKSMYEARKYMIEKIKVSEESDLNFSLTTIRTQNPKYKLAKRIEELEKELKAKKEMLEQYE